MRTIIFYFLVQICFLTATKFIHSQTLKESRLTNFSEKLKTYRNPISHLEKRLIKMGLIDVTKLDSTFILNIKYSTTDNFVGVDLYGNYDKCYLQKEVAQKLVNAQKFLKEINPELTLMIYDGARPKSVQQKMWDVVKMPIEQKVKFLSNPKRGSIHNYGCAVDVSLATTDRKELDMGTSFDHMGIEAHPVAEQKLLAEGRLDKKVITNRQLLRKVMYMAGFYNIQSEWWHFNSCRREVAKEKYAIIE